MALKRIKPALQDSEGRSKPWSGSRLVNCFAEASEGDKQADYAVMLIPGTDLYLAVLAETGLGAMDGPVRGLCVFSDNIYAVVGTGLYIITPVANVPTQFFIDVVDGTLPVRMDASADFLAIVADNGQGYVYDGADLTTPMNLPLVSDVIFIDGYFLWTVYQSDQFIISALNDGTSYDALDVATVEGSPDLLVGVVNSHRLVMFFGTNTIEIWTNTGDADFPFERQGNAFIERGCLDRDSLVKIDNSVMFVGDDRIVYRIDGYTPIRVSTHAIEYQMRASTTFRAFKYSQEGHKFYVLNMPTGSFAYDVSTGAWAERKSYGHDNYRIGCAASLNEGNPVLGDAYVHNLYTPNLEVYTENGDPIEAVIELPTLMRPDRQLGTMYQFELYCETGVQNGASTDPQALLSYSDDGGRTYSTEIARPMGVSFTQRCIWYALGQFRSRQMRIRLIDPVRRFIMAYMVDWR